MEDRSLRERLRLYCEEACSQLARDVRDGIEVPFEVVDESGGRGSSQPLWCYRNLTGEFIRQRLGALGTLPTYLPAAQALERVGGIEDWLEARGETSVFQTARDRGDAGLRVFLTEVLGESATFEFEAERFRAAWDSLEAIVFTGASTTVFAAPIHGIEMEQAELRLDGDIILVGPGSIEAEILPPDMFRGEDPTVVAMFETADATPQVLAQARSRLRRLVCALRLAGSATPALGGAGRIRIEGGAWQVTGTGGSGTPRDLLSIPADEASQIRSFCGLVERRWPSGGELAWAVRRHELGADRLHHLDALSDNLLALRALLEPEGPASGRLTARLAALCAMPPDRADFAARTARAVELERLAMGGRAGSEPEAAGLCEEVAQNLRALLRDVLAGHLDTDLCAVADSIIAEAAGLVPDERGFGDPEPLAA